MNPRRIALVASSYAPFIGGVEQHVAHIAAELVTRGHRVEVWTVARRGVAAVRNVDGITVRDLPAPLPARNLRALVRFGSAAPAACRQWLSAWRQLRPEVLHVQCFGPNGLYALGLSRLTGTPLVVSSHGETDADDKDIFGTSFLLPAGMRRAVLAAQAVTGCSASVKDDLESRFGASGVDVVPNGVSAVDVRGESRMGGLVVGAGRLEHNKGFDLLLRAVAEVPHAELLLVGDGRQRTALEELALALGVGPRVTFVGSKTQNETRAILAEAEVVVVPSRKESFGIVALEAWSAGTPLIATATCGPANFVSDGVDGLLIDPEDTSALAGAIRRVLADKRLACQLAVAGRQSVQSFTWGAVVDRYEAIYAGFLRNRVT